MVNGPLEQSYQVNIVVASKNFYFYGQVFLFRRAFILLELFC